MISEVCFLLWWQVDTTGRSISMIQVRTDSLWLVLRMSIAWVFLLP